MKIYQLKNVKKVGFKEELTNFIIEFDKSRRIRNRKNTRTETKKVC